jgi:hypothetical protein
VTSGRKTRLKRFSCANRWIKTRISPLIFGRPRWRGSPPPLKTEADSVPADHGVGLDDNQDFSPAGPTMAESGPEESVQGVQFWPWPFSFEHCDLLSQGQTFEGGITSTAQKDSDAENE